ncbi:alpha/beta fold hydrolase [Micromonospora sp. NPDC049374]|uniref:alpha/beta fold hydrolase n=1 Tax=Micromonospora sp. NPDC049374 TaxID=3154352 RepID=UPI00344A4C31
MTDGVFRFESFDLDVIRGRLSRNGQPIHVEPRAFALLCHLVQNRDRVVTKAELLDAVWRGRFVTEAALTTALRTARRAVGDDGSRQRLIRTLQRRGYQFVAPTTPGPAGAATGSGPTVSVPGPPARSRASGADREVIRFCRARDGTRIAYAVSGDGPPLVRTANWLTRIDVERTVDMWSHWFDGLTRDRQLIRYDERGSGLSDWTSPGITVEDWIADLDAVIDAMELDRIPLLGVSQGGAVALAYAAQRPERVSRLILAGAYARGRLVRAADDNERDAAAVDLDVARLGWLTQDRSLLRFFASQFQADAAPERWDEFVALQRQTTSAENGVRFLEALAHIDVSALAHQVRCPTLIIHSREDQRVPVAEAAKLASLIPDNRLVLLESRNHLLTGSEPAWAQFLHHVNSFLAA